MLKSFAFFIGIGICLTVAAQHENDTWYFGIKSGLKFNGSGVSIINTNPNNFVRAAMSDRNTGDLLFYSDGKTIWDKNNNIMPGGNQISTSNECIIIPFPGNFTKYYVITAQSYAIVDITLNSGLGAVTSIKKIYLSGKPVNFSAHSITAVRHAYSDSYWLITHPDFNNDVFKVYNISEKGFDTIPVISNVGPIPTDAFQITTSNDGEKFIVETFSLSDSSSRLQVYNFNKLCGTITPDVKLWRHPYWSAGFTAFSPDNSKIYVVWYTPTSAIIQYSGPNYSQLDTVSDNTLTHIIAYPVITPGNKLFLISKDASTYSYIDIIKYPDTLGDSCRYSKDYLNMGTNNIFSWPNFIRDKSTPGPNSKYPGIKIKTDGICAGDSTYITILPPLFPDSVKWNFGDTLSSKNSSTQFNPSHVYSRKGKYTITAQWYKCLDKATQTFVVDIQDFTALKLADTSFCYKDSLVVLTGIAGANYTWSTGSPDSSIVIKKPGKYWVAVVSANCRLSDTFTVKEIPPILIDLGGDYAICDDENELVKLDAGKGYERYKWTPTGDSTQWIIVNKIGDYYVVVEDFRGCKGGDGTVVNRLCGFTFYMPNAFTPNGDGLNDVFMPTYTDIYRFNIEIFNRWGERVFVSDDPAKGWDGTYKNNACPGGAYVWKLRFKGYQNKILHNYNYTDTVELLR